MPSYLLVVPFVSGKARMKFTRGGRAYIPTETRKKMDEIGRIYNESGYPKASEEVPVRLRIRCTRPMPKSRVRRDRTAEADTFKPDVDNIAKLVMDALNGLAWNDDKQVVSLTVEKEERRKDAKEEMTVEIYWENGNHGEVQGTEGGRD